MKDLDIEQPEALIAYLRARGRIEAQEQPRVRILSGGVSNRTVLVERRNGESWVLKQALARLRVPGEWFSDPQRIQREAEALRWLARLAPPGRTLPLLFEDHDHHLLAMGAVPQPHTNWKSALLGGEVDRRHVKQFGHLLGAIHGSAEKYRDALAGAFDNRSYFESLRVEPYYGYCAEGVPEAADFLRRLIDVCRRTRFTLVHGDFSPKNILVYQDQLVLLDHEVAHFGDGAFDLGFAMTHLLSKAHHLPERRGALAEAVTLFWGSYCETIGEVPWQDGLEARAVQHTLGCLLARVAGRSPLEYLDGCERDRQRRVVVALMASAPPTVAELVGGFVQRLSE